MEPKNEPMPAGIEVPSSEIVPKGQVEFASKEALSNPAPKNMKRIIKAGLYLIAGLSTIVGASDLFTGRQAKIIMFCLGIAGLVFGAMEIFFGVVPEKEKD